MFAPNSDAQDRVCASALRHEGGAAASATGLLELDALAPLPLERVGVACWAARLPGAFRNRRQPKRGRSDVRLLDQALPTVHPALTARGSEYDAGRRRARLRARLIGGAAIIPADGAHLPLRQPGCPELAVRRGRCRRHLREQRRRSPRPSDRDGWSWSRLRARILRRDPVCRRCHERPSAIVHHVVPIEHGGPDRDDNLIGVCRECSDELHYGISSAPL